MNRTFPDTVTETAMDIVFLKIILSMEPFTFWGAVIILTNLKQSEGVLINANNYSPTFNLQINFYMKCSIFSYHEMMGTTITE